MGGAALPLTALHGKIDEMLGAANPVRPRWLGLTMGVTGLAAVAGDLFVRRHLGRPLPKDDTREEIRKLYQEQAERLRAQQKSAAAAAGPVAAAPSKYLASEGAHDEEGVNGTEEGCVPCALGHEGATVGMTERAAEAAEREGRCGPECQSWMVPATREMLALLGHDLTGPRIALTPDGQRQAIEAHMDQTRGLADALVAAGDPDPESVRVRKAVLGASASIIEGTRFTDSGDPLSHPSVKKRLDSAESDLLAGERAGATTLDPEVKKRIRAARQDLITRTSTAEDLRSLAERHEEIDQDLMRPALDAMTPAQVRAIANQASSLRRSFKSAIAQAAEPIQAVIAQAAGGTEVQ